MLNRLFQLDRHGTTPLRELQAGLTTFAAMAYILAVNPAILANTGMDRGAVVTVTALVAALATLIMAMLTNYPIALAPGMGINAFFTFTICLGRGVPWSEALGMVFLNGVLFLILSMSGLRERLIAAISLPMKTAITCGIGLFIAFIGLRNGGVIVPHPSTLVAAGDFSSGAVALCLGGILLTIVLVARRVPGAIVLGMALITLAGVLVPDGHGGTVTPWREFRPPVGMTLVEWLRPHSPSPVFLKLTFHFLKSWSAFSAALPLILTLLLVDLFDNLGTLICVTKRAGLLSSDGTLPRAGRALVADSLATLASALFGTSTVVSYIESASGVEAGGRTGLTAVATATLFLLALFLTPLILLVPPIATAPALVVVGIFMMQSVVEIPMADFGTAAPAILTIFAIPLTFSIAEGIGLGLIAGALLAVGLGRPRSLPALGYLMAAVFFLQFFRIWPFGR
ncbi:MAG TPA: NCS2 family permease [Holophagaceae bacterium]